MKKAPTPATKENRKNAPEPQLLERILEGFDVLHLTEMRRALEQALEQPEQHQERLAWLWQLLQPQLEQRLEGRVERRIREARLPARKTFAAFDFAFQPSLDRDFILELATLRFVEQGKNLLLAGMSGSGKTTFTKALIREIAADERLITIEDARELVLDRHQNHVRLFYSKDDQGLARVTPKQLPESCLRMKPDRILLAELRGEEAFDYLRNVNSGHPGSITSIHAASAELAFEQLVLLVKQSRAGQELAREEIKNLLYMLIDVVVQFGVEHRERRIREVWYDPARRRRTLATTT